MKIVNGYQSMEIAHFMYVLFDGRVCHAGIQKTFLYYVIIYACRNIIIIILFY